MFLGQWDLSIGPWDSGPLRLIRLKQFLSVTNPALIMYEDVKFTPAKTQMEGKKINMIIARVATASELLGILKGTVTTWAEENNIPAEGASISEIKKYATGKGNSGKPAMIRACNDRFGTDFDDGEEAYKKEGTDNMADAAFVCAMGIDYYSEGLRNA
jgi:hypothetical protein